MADKPAGWSAVTRFQIGSGQRIQSTNMEATDGVEIFYKDWGSGQPIVFSHGWPLSSDDWVPN
jgi:hypothetical protein